MILKSVSNEFGFTLIELLIAIALMVLISVAIYRAVVNIYQSRELVAEEGDFNTAINLTVNILEHDLQSVYSPKMMAPDKTPVNPGDPNTDPNTASNPSPTPTPSALPDDERVTEYWGKVSDTTGIRSSRFQGKEDSLLFISNSHVRVYRESQESIFAKIHYELQDASAEDRTHPELTGTKVLVKKVEPNVFEIEEQDNSPSLKSYRLLHGIKKFKLSYCQTDKDRCEDRWDTESRDTPGLYPDVIQLELEVVGEKNRQFGATYRFRREVPIDGIAASF